jgi:uncharacterized cupin superfamily protein
LATLEGRTLHAFGHAVVVLLDGKQTGEKFTAFLNISPPGGGPEPHYHEREDEWFHIVEGQVSFFIDGTWVDVFPGDCVYSPIEYGMTAALGLKVARLWKSLASCIIPK